MSDIPFKVDQEALKDAFRKALQEHVTRLIAESVTAEEVARNISDAFSKDWRSPECSWMQHAAGVAFGKAMHDAVEEAIKECGIEEMVRQVVTEYVQSPEFQETLKRRAIEVVQSTSFFVKPEVADDA